jgi:cysteine desulfurase/selenocysteine lyase
MNWKEVRECFPTLKQKIHGKPLVYLDSAATALKPRVVIERIQKHYADEVSNVHRGIHFLSSQATAMFEETRQATKEFLNAESEVEIIFTRGATDSINLVAQSWGEHFLGEGDQILVSRLEHHSNFVPWQLMAQKKKASIVEIPLTDDGAIDMQAYAQLLGPQVKMVAITHTSNTLGIHTPLDKMIPLAREHGAHILVDAAQAAPHTTLDVQALDCDFLALSGHKVFGPTGVGVLYGKKDLLEQMPPYQGGGAMIKKVSFEETTFAPLPEKFEAGTPHIAGIIAFKAAIDFVREIGLDQIAKREKSLGDMTYQMLQDIEGIRVLGPNHHKSAVYSFLTEGAHPHDIGMLLDQQGIAIRTGHHCTQPLMRFFDTNATSRASFSLYNNEEDIERFIQALKKAKELL